MSDQQLPSTVAAAKLAGQSATISGTIELKKLRRLVAVLASDCGEVEASLRFSIDDQGRQRLGGELASTLQVVCQRCLQAMPLAVNSSVDVALVADDEAAERLPRELDPVITEDGVLDMFRFIEDELLLSVPFTSFHEHECAPVVRDDNMSQGANTQKPFADLADLLNNS